jgi:hypothetical protein
MMIKHNITCFQPTGSNIIYKTGYEIAGMQTGGLQGSGTLTGRCRLT